MFDIKKFAKLARIELTPEEEKNFGKDLTKILNHFEELQELDTKKVKPVTGGTALKNVFRKDASDEVRKEMAVGDSGTEQFPDSKGGYLKVPKVFENK